MLDQASSSVTALDIENNYDSTAAAIDSYCGFPILERGDVSVRLGEWPQTFLDQPIVNMHAFKAGWGPLSPWPDGTRGLKRLDLTVQGLAGAFNNPRVSDSKDGTMFMGGELKRWGETGTYRRQKIHVVSLTAMVFDSDCGQPLADIIPKLETYGRCYVLYTSHSAGKVHSKEPLRNLQRFAASTGTALAVDESPTDALLQRYLAAPRIRGADNSGRGYWPAFAASARVDGISDAVLEQRNDDGEIEVPGEPAKVEFSHDPVSKYRVIFPLLNPVLLTDDNRSQVESEWKARYVFIGEQIGLLFDDSCNDIARAFYSASCSDLKNYQCVIGGTTPLDLPPITPEMLERVQALKPPRRASPAGKKGKGKKGKDAFNVVYEYHCNSDTFDVVGWARDGIGWETVGWGSHDKQALRCPNEDKHSSTKHGDMACVAIDPGYQDYERAILTCRHDACEGLHTEDFLRLMCDSYKENNPTETVPPFDDWLIDFLEPAAEAEGATAAEAEGATAAVGEAPASQKKQVRKFDGLRRELKGGQDKGFKVEASPGEKDAYIVTYMSPNDERPQTVCDAFDVLGKAHDDGDSAWGLLLEIQNPKKDSRRVVVTESEVHGDNRKVRSKLAHNGLHIEYGGVLFEKLMMRLKPTNYVAIVQKPGWTADKTRFVCPDGTVVSGVVGEPLTVILDSPLSNQVAGHLDGQHQAWEIAIRHHSPQHFIGCVAGVAGCLVEYAGLDSTPVLTLSGTSSIGKTTSMSLAASAFGQPEITKGNKQGLLHSLRATPNAVEFLAERSNGCYLGLDETAQGDIATKLEELVFMLASGSGKNRMKADSTARGTKGWATFCLISSEQAMATLVERAGYSARTGFTARCADVDTTGSVPIPDSEYDRMIALLTANHGHVGGRFAQHILASGDSPETIRARINDKASSLAGTGASPLIRRSASVFAVLWETGALLGAAELLPDCLEEGEVERRFREIWAAYLLSPEAKALTPGNKAVERLTETLFARMGGDVKALGGDPQGYREALAWFDRDDANNTITFYVRTEKLVVLAGEASKARELTASLKASEILKPSSDKTLTWKELPGRIPVGHYRLTFSHVVT